MPVVFSGEIDRSTMEAGDFQVTTKSGKAVSPICVTLLPAIDEGELRTVLLAGDLGSAGSDSPVRVKIIGNIHTIDQALNFRGAEVEVIPLAQGPSLVTAEIVPGSGWHLAENLTAGAAPVPAALRMVSTRS